MKILIRNGMIYDGTGMPSKKGDVLVEKDKIIAVEPEIHTSDAYVIEGNGSWVAPGFVDIHRHCDVAVMRDDDFGRLELEQGITSTVTGNCGLAPIPVSDRWKKDVFDYINPVVGPIPEKWKVKGYGDWITQLRIRKIPLNMGFLIGAGAVKAAVNGYAKKRLMAGLWNRRYVIFWREWMRELWDLAWDLCISRSAGQPGKKW